MGTAVMAIILGLTDQSGFNALSTGGTLSCFLGS